MPTKRTPLNRERRRPISPEAAELFRQICKFAPERLACIQGIACKSATQNEHCADCNVHRDRQHELYRILRLRPWHDLQANFQEPRRLPVAERTRWWTAALEEALQEALDA